MLESLTIYSKGGLILFQYLSDPSLVRADDPASYTRAAINSVQLSRVGAGSTNRGASSSAGEGGGSSHEPGFGFHIKDGLTFVWRESTTRKAATSGTRETSRRQPWIVMALYPDILFEGPRAYLRTWAESLVQNTCDEYDEYCWNSYREEQDRRDCGGGDEAAAAAPQFPYRPDPEGFDGIFRSILQRSKTAKQESPASAAHSSLSSSNSTGSGKGSGGGDGSGDTVGSGGKEQRHWIGSGKVNEKTMSELDRSNPNERSPTAESEEQRLKEARLQYLPTQQELEQSSPSPTTSVSGSWGSAMTSLWQNLRLNKALTKEDLKQPIERMQQLLVEKNVATCIASKLCSTVERELLGKKLNTLHRVQTAVRQGLEKAIHGVLEPSLHVDLLREVLTKKETSPGWFGLGSAGAKKRRPFVICVLGINGIGKTTTVAKLAYYFQTHGCKVLLVAGDTFRSGAVEQLKTHASCLGCDIFARGYAKDPSAVATDALTHANHPSQPQYDVVLIDTAGRMQNNAPLMSALTKLVQTVPMDCTLLVAEALVGHDALSQYEMFHRAVRTIHGLILTKYDTVGTKVGAALTLTHETSTPIVFLGTGQKYHHLQTLDVISVINSLFST